MNLLESLFLPQTNLGREFHKILNGNRIEADEKAKQQIVKPDATRKKTSNVRLLQNPKTRPRLGYFQQTQHWTAIVSF